MKGDLGSQTVENPGTFSFYRVRNGGPDELGSDHVDSSRLQGDLASDSRSPGFHCVCTAA